jgi:hypothetical protein
MEADGGDGGLAVVVLTAPGGDEVPWSGENEARWSGERTKGRLKLTSCRSSWLPRALVHSSRCRTVAAGSKARLEGSTSHCLTHQVFERKRTTRMSLSWSSTGSVWVHAGVGDI